MLKFKIDENLPQAVAALLQESGYDSKTVLDQHLGGATDTAIASRCQQEDRVLITLDTDFADIRTYPPKNFSGLIVLRLKQQDKPYVLATMRRLIKMFSSVPLDGHLWIVEEERVRVRR